MATHPDGAAGTPGPAGYKLVVPDDWFSIELEPDRAQRAVTALVRRQFAGIDNAPHLKRQARRELLERTDAAWKAGGIEMFLSLMQVAGVPIAASLTTFLVPPPADVVSPDDLATALAAGGDEVTVVGLPAGRAVRLVRDSAAAPQWSDGPGPDAEEAPASSDPVISREVQVFVPVPGGDRAWLLLAFAAPLAPLADALTSLFDAVSQTLRWSQ